MGEILPFRIDQNVSCYDPIDAMWMINPEIASLAYANRNDLLKPEILPYVARFRELQTVEKLGVLNYLTENSRIELNERVNKVISRTQENIARLQESGAIERSKIEGQTLIDVSKLKYESRVRIVNAQMECQRYLSDNQLRATHIEAQALRDSIISSERIRAIARMKESSDNLEGVIKTAEFNYLSRFSEAEALRAIEDQRITADVVSAYLSVQGELYRSFMNYQIQIGKLKSQERSETFRGLAKMTKSVCVLLAEKDAREVSIDAETPSGPIKLSVRLK